MRCEDLCMCRGFVHLKRNWIRTLLLRRQPPDDGKSLGVITVAAIALFNAVTLSHFLFFFGVVFDRWASLSDLAYCTQLSEIFTINFQI